METTFSFGYWVRRRRKALNLTQAALAQQVGCATITIKKIERDERRPSRVMAERLADSLMLPPGERPSFLGGALGEAAVDALPIARAPVPAAPSAFTDGDPEERGPFVGREPELDWLEAQLELALAGQGRMVFIAGEAGRGKTALLAAMIRRAARARPALLVASGTCNAYAGTGDPYLPFREVVSTLTGEAEGHWLPQAHSAENTRRLWQALPTTLQLLVQHGPQLIDVLVPAKGLLARAQAAAPGGAAWLAQLQAEVARRQAGAAAQDQSALFGQFTHMLCALARSYPLLISLDDLHWADEASLGLLFHLTRRLAGSRILIVGAYRPEELISGTEGQPHHLEGALAEIKRMVGESSLDLDAADAGSGRAFVSAMVDTEPNHLDEAFREAFFHQTNGHALFTVELLREMRARHDLVQDAAGQWRPSPNLDWSTLPARVEAVIARRLDRLEPALRDVLTVASVEGELFTAEVAAKVLGVDEGLLLRSLSGQLARRHRLVRASGEIELAGRYLSPYQFGHALFQQYLYQQLDPGERRRLHAEVAGALEALYGGQSDDIAIQLARHFEAARMPRQAVDYLRRAGEKAIRLSASNEAVSVLQQGLALLATLPHTPDAAQQGLQLHLALGLAQRKAGQLAAAMDTFQNAAMLARETQSPEAEVRAALAYEESRWRFNLPAGPAIELLQHALAQIGPDQPVTRVRLQVSLAQALMPAYPPEQVPGLSRQALALARAANDPTALFDALYLNVRCDRHPSRSDTRLAYMEEMLRLAEARGEPEAANDIAGFRVLEHLERGEIGEARANREVALMSTRDLQQPFYEYTYVLMNAMLALMAGQFAEAEQLVAQGLSIGQQLQVENVNGVFGIQMFTIRREQGRLAELAPVVKHFVAQQAGRAVWRPGLALIYSELDLRAEARQEFDRLAEHDFASLPQDDLWVTSLVYLAEVCAYLGDSERAAVLSERLRPYGGRNIVVGLHLPCLGAASHYLGLLAGARSRWAEAELHFQEALEMNARMGAVTWLAHAQHQYGALLLARGRATDREYAQNLLHQAVETAGRLGMRALAEQAGACLAS